MDAREKDAAAQIVKKVKYELWKVIDRMNRKFYAAISLKDAEEVCEHFVKKLVNIQMRKLKYFQKFCPEGDVFQSFGRTRMFEELLKVDSKSIDELRHELIQEANLKNESMMAECLLHHRESDILIWRDRYWKLTRKSKLFLLSALCVDPPEMSHLIEIQQLFVALTQEFNRKIRKEVSHLQNPYFSQINDYSYNAIIKPAFWQKDGAYQTLDGYKMDSLLLNEKDYCVVKVYEKHYSEHEFAGSYGFRHRLYREILQKSEKRCANAVVSKCTHVDQLITETKYTEKKVGDEVECADVSQHTSTVNVSVDVSQYSSSSKIPVEKEQVGEVEKVETPQTSDWCEANNKQEEEQVYQQCVRKMHVLDKIKCFDFKEFYKKKEIIIEKSSDMSVSYTFSSSGKQSSVKLTPCQNNFIVQSHESDETSEISIVRVKPNATIPLQKPGLQRPEDVACGGFSEKKTKRRIREEPRPRTDPPKDSDDIPDQHITTSRYDFLKHKVHSMNLFPNSPHTGNLNEHSSNAFTESIRSLKDPIVQVSLRDKEQQHVLEFDHDFHWSDTGPNIITNHVHHHLTDPPDPWNLRTTYWRRAQEEHRPRKDPPTLVPQQHLPWFGHHGSTLVMAH